MLTVQQPARQSVPVSTTPETAELNRQLYPASPLTGSSIEQDYAESDSRLYNSKDPNFAIKHEKPEHRMAIYMKAQGLSNREIAKKLGFTEPWVSQILRQPWARLRLVEELRLAGRDAVMGLIEASAVDSVYRLIELRDQDEEKSVSRAASDSLLDRFLGKATQRVEAQSTVKHVSDDIHSVDREIAELEAEERRLTGAPQNKN